METHKERHSNIYNDYRLLPITVVTLAKTKLSQNINDGYGEVTLFPYLSPSKLKSRLKKTNIILAPNGHVVYPQSLYLVSKLRGEGSIKDTDSIAKGLLAFTRFLDSTHYPQLDDDGNEIPPEYLTYKTLTKYEEEGAPWHFAEHLLANCSRADPQGAGKAQATHSHAAHAGLETPPP